MKKIALLLLLLAGVVLPSQAEPGYVKFSLWDRTSAAIANNNTDEISGVDLGIGSYTPTLKGFQWDLIWAETFRLSGVSMSFGISKTGLAKGVQWAPVTIANELTCVQLGGVNMAGDLNGLQFGGINLSHRNITGGQLGFVNMGTTITGGQAGFFNSNHDFL